MPNGGSDCCGTCCFNSKNKGKTGLNRTDPNEISHCIIRDLDIKNPFYTYCANHPHHNPGRLEMPLGPVYVNDGYPYTRKVWVYPPDSEEMRLKLLDLLDHISNKPEFKYPSVTDFEEEIIMQLTALKETRAIEGFKRVINMDIDLYKRSRRELRRNKAITVGLALESLLILTDGKVIDEVKHFINYGIEEASAKKYNPERDNFAVIRYHFVRGLEYCKEDIALELLNQALLDPHDEIKAFAEEMIKRKSESPEIN